MSVFETFYVTGTGNCGNAAYTSFSGSGLNLDLINLGGAGVTNPQNVIDANPDNFSRLSLGVLAVSASVQQSVYFENPSTENEEFRIRLKVDPSLLALGVANNIQIIATNGTSIVETRSLSSLLNLDLLTLLQNGQAVIPFRTSAPANRITVRYSSLLNVQLTQSLDLYEIIRVPIPPTIDDPASQNPTICAGSTATLIANGTPGTELRWYDAAVGGNLLATVSSGSPFTTTNISSNTVFYVAAAKIGCPEESNRIPITVNTIRLPIASDIDVASELTACSGNTTIFPSSTIGEATINYYIDQNKTQEISTGFTGIAGVSFVKNEENGSLSVSGLTATNSPLSIFVALEINGSCDNLPNTLHEVQINFAESLNVALQPQIEGCGSVNLRNAISNFDPTVVYSYFDSANNPISAENAGEITVSGQYFIEATSADGLCVSTRQSVQVTVTEQPTITVPSSGIATQTGTTVDLNATSNFPITWYDNAGNILPSATVGPFSTPGIYSFTAIASNGNCSATATILVTVLDASACPPLTSKKFASRQRWNGILTGGVANAQNAADGNLQTYSNIVTGIGLLGIGTTTQVVEWDETIAAGTPVTLKLGAEYSGLALAEGFFVVGTKRNGSGTPVDIGVLQPVSGSLLNLLPGQNTFEYTFVPTNNSGPQAFDGVRLQIASTLSVAQIARFYEAYYETAVSQIACTGNDAEDVLFGAVDLGIGALTSTVGVSNPNNAIDNSEASFATMFTGVGVLAAAELTAQFRTPSISGDSVRIRISTPSNLLNLNVLSGFSVQPLLNNVSVGTLVSSSLLSLEVLPNGQEAILTFAPNTTFDGVRIRLGGVANVLDALRIHSISRIANTQVIGADENNLITVCQGQTITLEATPNECTNFIWYNSQTDGNALATGASFTIPEDLAAGTYTYYIQPVRFGCEFMQRGTVQVIVRETAPQTSIANVSINGGNVTDFCSSDANVTLQANLDAASTITNPVFVWYSFDGTTQQLIAGENSATLVLSNLSPGTYTYFVGLSSDEFCQTAVADLASVTFTILRNSIASDISVENSSTCLNSPAVVAPTSTQPNPLFTYYLSNDVTQPITSGTTFNGITYTVNVDGTLTATGITPANSPTTIFIGLSSDATCLNTAGNLTEVTLSIGNPPAPTTSNMTQNFCSANNPTVADLDVNEENILVYNLPIGGIALDPTTLLTSGLYYVTQIDGDCESDTRLVIMVTIGNPLVPTTNNLVQNFCSSENPTVANIQVNEANVVFYDLPISGTALSNSQPLVAGTYYAAIVDGLCESESRLAITVTISDVATPTTDNNSQVFCAKNNPTVADLDVNEISILFYETATSEATLTPETPLQNGTYFVSLIDENGCQSSTRLAISVTIQQTATPTTNSTTQNFCASENATVADIQVNETGVIFYDSAENGNILAPTTPLANGTYFAAISNGTCESEVRLAITVTISDFATPTTNATTQNFCASENATVADIQVNETGIIFYDSAENGNIIAPTTPLVNGTYFAAISNGTCESEVRLAITVTISDFATPTTNATTQNFCASENGTVADIQVNETGVIFYDSPENGNVIAPTTPLANGIYFAAISNGTCESEVRLAITVTISDFATPTTNATTQNFCAIENATVADIQVNETDVIFYDSAENGNIIAPTTPLANGTYFAAISNGTCESEVRLAITVTISDFATPTTNSATQNFCASENATVADIQVNEAGIIFYDSAENGNILAPTTPLANGTYFAAISNGTCESEVRLAITVTISDFATPTTNTSTQNFCASENATVADIQVNETGIIFYDSAENGNILDPTTPLANGTYFAAISNGTCESEVRLAITVTISDFATPTTNASTQNFCASENATVADIQVNETGVIFYDSAENGNILAPTTPLANGTYFAAISNGTCESEVRLAITLTISDFATPTTNATTQNFCASENATVADIQVNETGVIFYDSAENGNIIAPTTPLANGMYFVAISNGTCESEVRLAITVTISDFATPTTNSTTQNFCASENATVADIEVNETGVIFYDSAENGNIIAPTTPLANGTYFAAISNGTCESEVRLAITVTVSDFATPTTNSTTQNFCASENATVADIQVNETGIIFYDSAENGNIIAPTTPLANGTYFAVISNGTCESEVRLAITVTISDFATPTTNATTQNFCAIENATVANLQVNETGIIFYDSAENGNIIAPTTPLANGTYFAAISNGTCESEVRLAITVTISDFATPTTNATTQNFCASENATVADIQVNETGIIFYDSAENGNIIAPTTPLANGTYFAAISNGTCESEVRLAITVTISDFATPTTNALTQNFCTSQNATVADIQVNETGVIFYDSAENGNIIAPTMPLANGTYFAAISNGTCESEVRLAITVTISDFATPTTNATTQNFCASENATVADIQVNETGVIFYDSAENGNVIAPTTPLANGTYFAAISNGTCESEVRLAITVTISDSVTATISGGSDTSCVSSQVTYTTLPGMTDYVWDVTNGEIISGGQLSDNFVTVQWTSIGTGTVSVSFENASGCASDNFASREILIGVCSDITITKTVNNPNAMVDETVVFTITVSNSGESSFENVVISEQIPSGYQLLSSNASIGIYNPLSGLWAISNLNSGETAVLTITVKVLSSGEYMNTATIISSNPEDSNDDNNVASAGVTPTCLMVFNEFSPNDDGDNDLFRIECIENYPNNSLRVHNRYGVEVFRTRGYRNDWDGTANVNSPIDQDRKLPSGTYYYILDLGDGSPTKTGWIYIIR